MKFKDPFDSKYSETISLLLGMSYLMLLAIALAGIMVALIISRGLLLLFIIPCLLFFVMAGDGK